MDLAKAGAHVVGDQDAGALEGGRRGLRLPDIGTEMIAPEQHPLTGEPDLIRQAPHDVPESRGLEAGVTAVLIHLVGGGFDQHGPVGGPGVLQGRAQHQRVGRADGSDPHRFTGTVALHQLEQCSHRSSSGSMASSAAAANASTTPVILSGGGTMPRSASARSAVMSGAPALVSGETTIALP